MIVRVLSLGSYWREPKDGRAVLWNSSGVWEPRGLRLRSVVPGYVRFSARLYQEAQANGGLRGTCWHSSPLGNHRGLRTLALLRRAPLNCGAEFYVVAVNEALVGELDPKTWDGAGCTLIAFSQWKSSQEALLMAPAHGWIRGASGSAVLSPTSASGDWDVARW